MQQPGVHQRPGGHGHPGPQCQEDRGARDRDPEPPQPVPDVVVAAAQRGASGAAAGDHDEGGVGEGHRRQGGERGPRGAAGRGGGLDQRPGGGQHESGELRPARAEPEAGGVPGVEQEAAEARHQGRRQQREGRAAVDRGAREEPGGGDDADDGEQPVGVVEQGEGVGDEDGPEHGQDGRDGRQSGEADDEDGGGRLDGEAQDGAQRLQVVDEAEGGHGPGSGEQPRGGRGRVVRRAEPQGAAGRRGDTEHGGRATGSAQQPGACGAPGGGRRSVGAERRAAGDPGECDRDQQCGHTGGDDPQHVHLPCLSSFMTCGAEAGRPVNGAFARSPAGGGWGHRTPLGWRP